MAGQRGIRHARARRWEQTLPEPGVGPESGPSGNDASLPERGMRSPRKVPKAFNLRQPFGKRSLNR